MTQYIIEDSDKISKNRFYLVLLAAMKARDSLFTTQYSDNKSTKSKNTITALKEIHQSNELDKEYHALIQKFRKYSEQSYSTMDYSSQSNTEEQKRNTKTNVDNKVDNKRKNYMDPNISQEQEILNTFKEETEEDANDVDEIIQGTTFEENIAANEEEFEDSNDDLSEEYEEENSDDESNIGHKKRKKARQSLSSNAGSNSGGSGGGGNDGNYESNEEALNSNPSNEANIYQDIQSGD